MMLQLPQLVTQLGQSGAAQSGAAAGQPYYFNAGHQVQSVQAMCSMRLPEAAPPGQMADLAAQADASAMPPPPPPVATAVATAVATPVAATTAVAAAAPAPAPPPPPPAHEPRPDDFLRQRPARPAEPAQPLAQPAPVPAMRPPAFANPAALGGMPHWFSPPAFANMAKPAPAAPAPLPATALSDQARCYSKPHANVFTVPPAPAHKRDREASRIDVSHLAALSAVPDAAVSAQLATAALLQREQANAARPSSCYAPLRAAPIELAARPNHDAAFFTHAALSPPQRAVSAYGASPFAAASGGGGAAMQQPATTTPGISPTWLLDSLTVEEFVSLRSSRERELSSRELVDFTCGATSMDSTLLEDAGRFNLSSFTGLAGLLDAL